MSTDASSNHQDGSVVDKTRYLPAENEDWSDWSKYQCGYCGENCINPTLSEFFDAKRCVRCFYETEDERLARLEDRKIRNWSYEATDEDVRRAVRGVEE
mgnify:CR=1 FL=1